MYLRKIGITVALLVLVGVGITAALPPPSSALEIPDSLIATPESRKKWERVLEGAVRLREEYHRELSEEDVADLMMSGVQTIDPHTVFLDPEQKKRLMERMDGEFGGLGISFMFKMLRGVDGTTSIEHMLVTDVNEDAPAKKAKPRALEKDDIITDIVLQGVKKSLSSMTSDEVISTLRGKVGSVVEVYVVHKGAPAELYTITRGVVKLKFVKSELKKDGIGYIALDSFSPPAVKQLEDAVASLKKEYGNKPLKGYVFDLRNNPGGNLYDATDPILDRMLAQSRYGKGMVTVWTERRGHAEPVMWVGGTKDILEGAPLVVLVNGFSASASEIAAGVLQAYGRAVVVGTPTYGKGSVQTVIPLKTGGLINVTSSQYLVGPCRKPVQSVGVIPDILLKAEDDEKNPKFKREKDLENALATSTAEDKKCVFKFSVSAADKAAAQEMIKVMGLELAPQEQVKVQ